MRRRVANACETGNGNPSSVGGEVNLGFALHTLRTSGRIRTNEPPPAESGQRRYGR